jgi:hypothetical protein
MNTMMNSLVNCRATANMVKTVGKPRSTISKIWDAVDDMRLAKYLKENEKDKIKFQKDTIKLQKEIEKITMEIEELTKENDLRKEYYEHRIVMAELFNTFDEHAVYAGMSFEQIKKKTKMERELKEHDSDIQAEYDLMEADLERK